ncbi:unnamed protein product [Owenia fusiformis]|uniref:Uncharacterized protein n=1 Tax=Owenia fusiformis TaxID=6347 RepID=A0A8J1TAE5_OWEFU|nr:unnamed protein product [Owenia fusiformis]
MSDIEGMDQTKEQEKTQVFFKNDNEDIKNPLEGDTTLPVEQRSSPAQVGEKDTSDYRNQGISQEQVDIRKQVTLTTCYNPMDAFGSNGIPVRHTGSPTPVSIGDRGDQSKVPTAQASGFSTGYWTGDNLTTGVKPWKDPIEEIGTQDFPLVNENLINWPEKGKLKSNPFIENGMERASDPWNSTTLQLGSRKKFPKTSTRMTLDRDTPKWRQSSPTLSEELDKQKLLVTEIGCNLSRLDNTVIHMEGKIDNLCQQNQRNNFQMNNQMENVAKMLSTRVEDVASSVQTLANIVKEDHENKSALNDQTKMDVAPTTNRELISEEVFAPPRTTSGFIEVNPQLQGNRQPLESAPRKELPQLQEWDGDHLVKRVENPWPLRRQPRFYKETPKDYNPEIYGEIPGTQSYMETRGDIQKKKIFPRRRIVLRSKLTESKNSN